MQWKGDVIPYTIRIFTRLLKWHPIPLPHSLNNPVLALKVMFLTFSKTEVGIMSVLQIMMVATSKTGLIYNQC